MRKNWTARAEKTLLIGSLISISLLPEVANAALNFSSLTNLAKDIVSFLIFDIGYYLGILAIVITGYKAKSGHIS
ncbi:TrbC/VirB2 family protein, partial [Vibrio cholerae]|uniref:TrbC/VirB2 family protein n=1 Tax=Vibrio cholerae TaxID=666 RepID=UPI001C11536E